MEHKPSVLVKDIYEAQKNLLNKNYERWIHDVLFSFNWWFLLVVTIIPYIVWWKLVDKHRLLEIIFVGLFILSLSTMLDVMGIALSLWTYGYKIIQMIPPLNPVDVSVLPVVYMLFYQWLPRWKSFIGVLVLFSLFASFVAEPLFVWMDIYILHAWKSIYSFPIYIAMGIGVKALTEKLMAHQINKR